MNAGRNKSVRWLWIATWLLSLVFAFPRQSWAGTLEPSSDIIYLTNQARLRNGLNALEINPLLTLAAQHKASDMLDKGYFDHTSPDGRQPWDFIQAEGYQYIYAGENLAMDYLDASSMFQGWMNSPAHRSNILFPDYQEIGVTAYSQTTNEGVKVVAVQMFGSRSDFRAPAPALIDQNVSPTKTVTLIDGQRPDASAAGYISSAFTNAGQQLEMPRRNKNLAAFSLCYGAYGLIVAGCIVYFGRRQLWASLPRHVSAGDVLSHPGL
jgi:hypothetical protein